MVLDRSVMYSDSHTLIGDIRGLDDPSAVSSHSWINFAALYSQLLGHTGFHQRVELISLQGISVLHICWGAQAGLYYHYGLPKRALPEKLSGIYLHSLQRPKLPLVRGFDDRFYAPHSRHTEVSVADVLAHQELELIALSDRAGVYIVAAHSGRQIFVTGHPEYDAETLALEYRRDSDKGLSPAVPFNYFPGDDPTQLPLNLWRSHANLLYSNWLNYYVYQSTPYDLGQL